MPISTTYGWDALASALSGSAARAGRPAASATARPARRPVNIALVMKIDPFAGRTEAQEVTNLLGSGCSQKKSEFLRRVGPAQARGEVTLRVGPSIRSVTWGNGCLPPLHIVPCRPTQSTHLGGCYKTPVHGRRPPGRRHRYLFKRVPIR